MRIQDMWVHGRVRLALALAAALMVLWGPVAAEQTRYPTAEAAVQALLDAARAEGSEALLAVLGPTFEELGSGDPVADRLDREHFVEMASQGTRIEEQEGGTAILNLGDDGWPFPIPLVKEEGGWRFDTETGKEELFNRRIGRNELRALAVLRGLVEAQFEYASEDRTGAGKEYAQRLASSEGKRDGLYWRTAEGEPDSPIGPLVADAVKEGYGGSKEGEGPRPYHGYLFRLLTAQGPNAPGGAKSYLKDGRLTGGFAFLAYPGEYGNSGVMTFLVNQQGVVFQKDLGEESAKLAAEIQAYDPDASWDPTPDDVAEE